MSHEVILNFKRSAERLVPRINNEQEDAAKKEKEDDCRYNQMPLSLDEAEEK